MQYLSKNIYQMCNSLINKPIISKNSSKMNNKADMQQQYLKWDILCYIYIFNYTILFDIILTNTYLTGFKT